MISSSRLTGFRNLEIDARHVLQHVVSRMIKERAIRPDAAERILAELRSATPPVGKETIGSSKSDPLANDCGYSA